MKKNKNLVEFNKALLLMFLLLFETQMVLMAQEQKVHEDENFLPVVGAVQLYPVLNIGTQEMKPPVISLAQTTELLLQFDLFTEEYETLYARLIHCNADWKKSILSDIEFLYDFNEFDIRNFEYSGTAMDLYVNYWTALPKVKKSGNYIVQVYRDGRDKEVLFQRRFVVFESLVNINSELVVSGIINQRRTHQQLNFDIAYSSLDVNNPSKDFKVVLRQNGRWDNAITGLSPTRMNPFNKINEYRYFNSETNFRGGNEFRFFDIRNYSSRGMNISYVKKTDSRIDAFLNRSASRWGLAYSQINEDVNGGYLITTNEPAASYIDINYIYVHFDLVSPRVDERVYVIGAFNHWKKDQSNLMVYNEQTESYQATIRLKQGYYNYMYWSEGNNPYQYEGSHDQTENDYEIMIYFRGFTDLADRLVGYVSFSSGL